MRLPVVAAQGHRPERSKPLQVTCGGFVVDPGSARMGRTGAVLHMLLFAPAGTLGATGVVGRGAGAVGLRCTGGLTRPGFRTGEG